MTNTAQTRRTLLLTGAAATTTGSLLVPAQAANLAPTPTMRGGANNYQPGAAITDRIGAGGFTMSGTVRRAGDGTPLPNVRIQIWAHTIEGYESDPQSHGATLTDENGVYIMDMPQIVPAFGQPHAHLAYDADYDENGFETVFLRPIMASSNDISLEAHFVLKPA